MFAENCFGGLISPANETHLSSRLAWFVMNDHAGNGHDAKDIRDNGGNFEKQNFRLTNVNQRNSKSQIIDKSSLDSKRKVVLRKPRGYSIGKRSRMVDG